MTITIPTAELLGLITDVAGFMPANKEDYFHGLLLSWEPDSEALTASVYGVFSGARATWIVGEGREQENLGERSKEAERVMADGADLAWGSDRGEGDRFSVWIGASDAAAVLKVFKVPNAFWRLPLEVGVTVAGKLVISRSGDWGVPAQTMTIKTESKVAADFPPLGEIIADGLDYVRLTAESGPPAIWSHVLGALGTVRSHRPMALRIAVSGHPHVLDMNPRWVGFAYGAEQGDTAAAQARRRAIDL